MSRWRTASIQCASCSAICCWRPVRRRRRSTEYERALKQSPNRYRGIYGAARAAEAAGDRRVAVDYYNKLIALSQNADGARPELQRAQAYVAQR